MVLYHKKKKNLPNGYVKLIILEGCQIANQEDKAGQL